MEQDLSLTTDPVSLVTVLNLWSDSWSMSEMGLFELVLEMRSRFSHLVMKLTQYAPEKLPSALIRPEIRPKKLPSAPKNTSRTRERQRWETESVLMVSESLAPAIPEATLVPLCLGLAI